MDEQKLIIVGAGKFAEIAYEYFTHDSSYEVVGFAVEKAYIQETEFCGLPVVPLEEITAHYDPAAHFVYVAIVFNKLNRIRTRLVQDMKDKGYRLASYVSSRAFVWKNVALGEHCFIFEDNTVQPFVTIGDNVILWSGNHIGHHSTIEDNVFISSHVVVSGSCTIGRNSFLGVNATFADALRLGADCWIGPGTVITKNLPDNTFFKAPRSEIAKISAKKFCKVED